VNKSVAEYQTLVFDCDGVVLNSNKIKTQAFYQATLQFGHKSAQALVDYHVANGGISRYAKVEYFITKILNQEFDEKIYQGILIKFAQAVKNNLMRCEVAEGLHELREKTKDANWLIVSGGDQAELRDVFAARALDKYFDGGIFGSPDTKTIILSREIQVQNILQPALFIGDSKYDYQVARNADLDFVFLSDWTEVKDWKVFCGCLDIDHLNNIKEMLAC
jgi:HAD superfamily hydrolase (TIGR01549 family)